MAKRLIWLGPMVLTAFGAGLGAKQANAAPVVTTVAAKTFDCDEEACRSVEISTIIENNSNLTYCIPEEFSGQLLSENVYFRDEQGKLIFQSVPARMLPHEGDLRVHDRRLQSEPQIAIAPHSSKKLIVTLMRKFEIPLKNARIFVQYTILNCSQKGKAGAVAERLTVSESVSRRDRIGYTHESLHLGKAVTRATFP